MDEAAAILLTPSEWLVEEVAREVERQLATLPRKEIARACLEKNGGLVLTRDLAEAVELANFSAPEHLELMVADPHYWLTKVRHAGAVFWGALLRSPSATMWPGATMFCPPAVRHGSLPP